LIGGPDHAPVHRRARHHFHQLASVLSCRTVWDRGELAEQGASRAERAPTAGDLQVKVLSPAAELVWVRILQECGDLAQRDFGLTQQQDQPRRR